MSAAPIVFAYDFPHKKSQDVILRLVAEGITPAAVIAAPRVDLGIQSSGMRVKPRHVDLLDLRELCATLKLEYYVADHASDMCLDIVDLFKAPIGVVGGARILPPSLIERFAKGILNLHPGLIPDVRGLDALQWAIFNGLPIGVTAHLIDQRVDAGRVVAREVVNEYPDDSLVDLSLRLYETQLRMLAPSLRRALNADQESFEPVGKGKYNPAFPADLVPQLMTRFAERRDALGTRSRLA